MRYFQNDSGERELVFVIENDFVDLSLTVFYSSFFSNSPIITNEVHV